MTDTPGEGGDNQQPVKELGIKEAVAEVEEIIATLEEGEIPLSDAKDLRERAERLLTHIEDELEVGDGELNRVEHS